MIPGSFFVHRNLMLSQFVKQIASGPLPISRGIHKFEELLAEMEKDEKTLKANNQAVFHNNTLKAWATEQKQYDEVSINQIGVLKTTVCDNLNKLLSTKESLQRVFKCLPSTSGQRTRSRKSRRR